MGDVRKQDALAVEALQDYLRIALDSPQLVIEAVNRFGRGISRETWSIRIAGPDLSAGQRLILRRDLPGCAIVPTSLRFEYDVYRLLARTAVPVAEALMFEDDRLRAPDGRPFYLRREVEGDWEVPNYANPDPAYAQLRVDIAREHLRKLAAIHALDWRAAGFGEIMDVPDGPADCGRCAVDRNYAVLRQCQIEQDPILTEAREWLRENAPAASHIALLKGTNGIGEEIFKDGQIAAMSDWEQASLGDPACDLARAQDVLAEVRDGAGTVIWGVDEALAYYAEVSGNRISADSLAYYRKLVAFENSVALAHGIAVFCDGRELSAKVGWLSTEIAHYGRSQLIAAVIGALGADASDKFLNTQTA